MRSRIWKYRQYNGIYTDNTMAYIQTIQWHIYRQYNDNMPLYCLYICHCIVCIYAIVLSVYMPLYCLYICHCIVCIYANKTGDELKCYGRVSSARSTSGQFKRDCQYSTNSFWCKFDLRR
jgi:Ca2+/Na+ antiporter